MELHLISKMSKRGFTLIEMVLVLGLISLMGVASVTMSLPAMSQFSCVQESKALLLAVERARHISQFRKVGNVGLQIQEHAFQIFAEDYVGRPVLLDEVDRRSTVPAVSVLASDDIVFQENSGALPDSVGLGQEIVITVGGADFGCERIIRINHVGAIL